MMPYILVHPLPPPHRNPYTPDLPTFTTSSRAIAHFFHSHGWRARHVHYPPTCASSPATCPSQTPSPSSSVHSLGYISASSLSQAPPPNDETECCRNTRGSSIVSCGSIIEIHSYDIAVDAAIFHGPFASARQLKYLLYYAWPHIEFEDHDGIVDLHLPNTEAMAAQKEKNREFWRQERKALCIKKRKVRDTRKAGKAQKVREKADKEKRKEVAAAEEVKETVKEKMNEKVDKDVKRR